PFFVPRDGLAHIKRHKTPQMRPFLAKSQRMRSSESARWARQDSNLQPDRYERPALTIELQAPPALPLARQATVPTPLTGWPAIPQCRVGSPCRSTETPANSTTLRHFSVSSATSLPNSARGAIGLAIPPISVNRAAHLGSFSASPTTWLRTATIGGGAPLGTDMP